jgi:hypothetical protein
MEAKPVTCGKCGASIGAEHIRELIATCPFCKTANVIENPNPLGARAATAEEAKAMDDFFGEAFKK